MEHFEKQLKVITVSAFHLIFIHEINSGLIFTPEVFVQWKKSKGTRVEDPETVNIDTPP